MLTVNNIWCIYTNYKYSHAYYIRYSIKINGYILYRYIVFTTLIKLCFITFFKTKKKDETWKYFPCEKLRNIISII